MQKDNFVYLGHMLDMAVKALEITRGKTRKAYDCDETLRLALAHLIQNIGEAAGRVLLGFRKMYPQIP